MKKNLILACLLALTVGFTACEKEKPEPPAPDSAWVSINDGPKKGYVTGNLSAVLTGTVTKLVFGDNSELNGSDIKAIRTIRETLQYLDMKKATIIEGGDVYFNESGYTCTTTRYVIGAIMFYQMKQLKSLALPANTISIEEWAFGGCESISAVDIPTNVISIGNNAFLGCHSLKTITIPASVTNIGYSAFYRCTALTTVNLPAGLEHILSETFYGCTALVSITLPIGLKTIGSQTFSNCTNLTSVTFPNGFETIGWEAFSDCNSLTNLTLPASIAYIGQSVFFQAGVKTLNLQATTPPILHQNSFYGANALNKINVPKSATAAYNTELNTQNNGWRHSDTGTINLIPGGSVVIKWLAGHSHNYGYELELTLSAILD